MHLGSNDSLNQRSGCHTVRLTPRNTNPGLEFQSPVDVLRKDTIPGLILTPCQFLHLAV